MARKSAEPLDPVAGILRAYTANEHINQYLLENLEEEAWRAPAPGGKGRTIAAIAAHMHNVRLMWLKAVRGAEGLPEKLEPAHATREQALAAFRQSYRAIQEVLEQSLTSDGQVKGFKPDVMSFFGYLIAHDAHHRGQISSLARMAGYALPQAVQFGMWEWGTRLKDSRSL